MRESKFTRTDIGVFPEDWTIRTIGETACVTTGAQNTQDKEDDGLYPFYVRSQKVERINKYIFDTEGVVTAGDGVGTGKVYHYVNGKFGLHQRCYLIYNFKEALNCKYFFWIFSQRFYERVHSMTAKSSVDSVRRDMITEMQIPIPPTIAEQERIAEALSDVDRLLRELDGVIAKKRAIKQGAMQELLTGKRRLEGFGETKTKKTEIGEIPEDWIVTTLGSVVSIFDGTHQTPSYVDYGYSFYSVENVTANDFTNTKYISKEEFEFLTKSHKIEYNDVLMTRIGSIGVCKYVDWKPEAAFYVSLALLKVKNAKSFSMKYLAYASNAKYFIDSVLLNSLQFAIPQKINLGEISKIAIAFPPSVIEQEQIAESLNCLDEEIDALETKRAKYEQGKIRLV